MKVNMEENMARDSILAAGLPQGAVWRKSSFSDAAGGNCLEAAVTARVVGVRDTKRRDLPHHSYSPVAWGALLDGVRAGEFDLPGTV